MIPAPAQGYVFSCTVEGSSNLPAAKVILSDTWESEALVPSGVSVDVDDQPEAQEPEAPSQQLSAETPEVQVSETQVSETRRTYPSRNPHPPYRYGPVVSH